MSNEPPLSPLPDPASDSSAEMGPSDDEELSYRLSSPSPMIVDPQASPVLVPPRPVAKRARKSKSADYWAMWGYNALVFITSVCVMTLELTASRLVAKTVGSSLYTWTSVIGVVLAGITLGNFLGGWLADRYDRTRSLAWMYLFGSISCASVLWMDQLVSPLPRPAMLSWPAWVLTVVAVMFLLPSLALGTISPLVASMALSRSSRLGRTVGSVYAWGALGSIIGTFLTGFYLMDVWGARSIVGMTAATMGLLAIAVAGTQRIFRTAVICGWLQLLGWTVLAATCTQRAMADMAETVGTLMTVSQTRDRAAATRTTWAAYGSSLGTKLHELGLLLKLRDDRVGAYYDESNYSTIIVTDGSRHAQTIKMLRLDKLIHSYYDPANPTALHYEYEQVYAAVTKRTARLLTQPVTLSTGSLPAEAFGASQLPSGTTFNAENSTLHVEQPTPQVFDILLKLAPDAAYWHAIDELHKETTKPLWGGFAAVPLEQLSHGIVVPEELSTTIRYDRSLEVLTAYDVVTDEIRNRLINETPSAEWYREVQRAQGKSRRATGLCLGGGGYVLPRWFLKEFPGTLRIEVAELDPAVYVAAVKALGMTPAEQQRIRTSIGDARNFVDDRLRENQRLAAAGKPQVHYDFVYGDAFNDFSIPAHLTTREFLKKVHDLLNDNGVLLANIIDIYPRVEYPGRSAGTGEAEYRGPLPVGLAGQAMTFGQYQSAGWRFEPLEIKSSGNGVYRLRVTRTISAQEEQRLGAVDFPVLESATIATGTQETASGDWQRAIESLAAQTRRKVPFEGSIPAALKATDGLLEAWTPAVAPWDCVEVCRLGSSDAAHNDYSIGFRGIVSPQIERQLIDLDSNNQEWVAAVRSSSAQTRINGPGRFLGRYVATAAAVFSNIYVYSASGSHPGRDRDTFVMVCSRRPLDLRNLSETGDWKGDWFAALESRQGDAPPRRLGQMDSVLSLSEGQILTDDFAPVDNLLRFVFADQE